MSLFRAVADGSLDHGMATDRADMGPESEARQRLDTVSAYRGEPDWFSVAFDPDEQPVGYVVPCLMEDDIAVMGDRRCGRPSRDGYVNDLLSRATRLLATSGADRIAADTDVANTPMRAAFRTAGYREHRWRDDYRWTRAPSSG